MQDKVRKNILLKVVSVLLAVSSAAALAITGVAVGTVASFGVDAFGAELEALGFSSADPGALAFIGFVFALGIVSAALELVAGVLGLRLLRGKGSVRRCELLGITVVGTSVVAWLVERIFYGTLTPYDLGVLASSILLPALYYIAVRRESTSGFWDGIKREAEVEPKAQPVVDVVDRFALDAATGILHPAQDGEEALVEYLSLDEYESRMGDSPITRHVAFHARSIHHCSANTFGSSVYGTLLIPAQEFVASNLPFTEDVALAFCISRERLMLVGNSPAAAGFVSYYAANQMLEKHDAAEALFELVDLVVRDDMLYLIDVEDRLGRLEDNMNEDVNEIPQDFSDFVLRTRSELHALESFYRQLSDVADTVATSPAQVTVGGTAELFRALSARVDRLAADARGLRDYSLQIRGMYQEKIDVRQNKVMSVLTIVTSIFMPLTLLTGWYGMNFDNMPELHNPNAYFVVIALAVTMVTVEAVVFKVKRWF